MKSKAKARSSVRRPLHKSSDRMLLLLSLFVLAFLARRLLFANSLNISKELLFFYVGTKGQEPLTTAQPKIRKLQRRESLAATVAIFLSLLLSLPLSLSLCCSCCCCRCCCCCCRWWWCSSYSSSSSCCCYLSLLCCLVGTASTVRLFEADSQK